MKLAPNSYLGSPGRPSWSADGKKVALSLNREAVIVERESNTVLTRIGPEDSTVGAPKFSPTGEALAYDIYQPETKKWGIKVSRPDGSDPELIVAHGRSPQWSPDGKKIAFNSYTDDFQTKVSVVDPDGDNQHEVSEQPHFKDFSWSPDGKQIAYEAAPMSGFELRTTNLESGEEKVLSNGDDGAYWDRTPSWSPSGQTIVFERRHKQFPAGSIWSVDPETGLEKTLFQKFADAVDPIFSPDGKNLIFGSNHGGRGNLDLFSMNLDNLEVSQLTNLPGDEHSPAFSPDGQTIAFLNTNQRKESGQRQSLHFQDL